jgi:hypothetical protein
MMVSAFTLTPATSKTDLTTMTGTAIATIVTRTNIDGTNGTAGTGTIIGTITTEIMIGTTTGIDVWRFSRSIKELLEDTV